MIGPNEWGTRGENLKYLAKVTLLGDRTWKVEDSQD